MKILMNMFWPPVQALKDEVDKSNGVFVPVSSNLELKKLNDEWIDKHVVFEQDWWDNLSKFSKNLSEMTTAYLALKNSKTLGLDTEDVVGLCHYRRFFNVEAVKKAFAEHKDLEAILSTPAGIGTCGSVKNQYALAHYADDFKLMLEEAKQIEGFNTPVWNGWTELPYLPFPCNLVVAKREVFFKWLDDLFKVILPLADKIDVSGRDNYQKRALGFLAERYTSYWFYNRACKGLCFGTMQPELHEDWKPKDSGDSRGNYT